VLGPSAGHSDLVVTAVTDPPATAMPSASFQIAATVGNQGTDPAPPTTTTFYVVNTSTGIKKGLKGGQSVPALAPGANASSVVTVTLYAETVAGAYFVQACADAPKSVSELNETNNCGKAAQALTVLPVPNLLVSSKYYLVSIVDGTKKALQGTQVVPPLDNGQTFSTQETLTVRDQTPTGQYKAQACAKPVQILTIGVVQPGAGGQ